MTRPPALDASGGNSFPGIRPGLSKTPERVHIARNLALGGQTEPSFRATPTPGAESCDCAPCARLSAALDAHREAIAHGRGAETREAVRLAAQAVDVAHGLGRGAMPDGNAPTARHPVLPFRLHTKDSLTCEWCGSPMAPARGPGQVKLFCDRSCGRALREYNRDLPGWLAEMARLRKMRRTVAAGFRCRIDTDMAILETMIARKGARP